MNMNTNHLIRWLILAGALIFGVSAAPALAKNGKHRNVRQEQVVIDRDGHRRVVHEYFTTEALPPGLAKRETLPPGLRRQLVERGQFPPGLRNRTVPPPPALVDRFPAVPSYYSRYFVGRDLVVEDMRTHRILAVIPNVF